MSTANALLDARGLLCPLPVIRTQNRVRELRSGAHLEVLATDPGALHDIRAWCRVHGHEYLEDSGCDARHPGDGSDDAVPHFHIHLRVSD